MSVRERLEALIEGHQSEAKRLSDPQAHYSAKADMIAEHLLAAETYRQALKAHLKLL